MATELSCQSWFTLQHLTAQVEQDHIYLQAMLTSSDYNCLVSDSFLLFLTFAVWDLRLSSSVSTSPTPVSGISTTERLFACLHKYAHILITAVSIWSINCHSTLLYNEKLSTPFSKQKIEAQTVKFMVTHRVCLKRVNCVAPSQVLSQHCFSSSCLVAVLVKKSISSFKLFPVSVCTSWGLSVFLILSYSGSVLHIYLNMFYTKLTMSMYNYDIRSV